MKRLMCCLAVAAAWPTTAAVTARACDPRPVVVLQSAPALLTLPPPRLLGPAPGCASVVVSGRAFPHHGQRFYYSTWGGYHSGYRSFSRFGSPYRWGWR